jgi:hypothetical protein
MDLRSRRGIAAGGVAVAGGEAAEGALAEAGGELAELGAGAAAMAVLAEAVAGVRDDGPSNAAALGVGNDEAMEGTVPVGFQPTGVARQGSAQY